VPFLNIPHRLRLTTNGLVIRPTTYGQLAALNHPLWRDEPPAAHRPRFHYFVVGREDDGAIVSSLDIEEVDDGSGTLSMSWATISAEQQKGYASKSARRLIEWLFQQPGINQIEIDIASENEAKLKTANRIGFKRTAKPGRWRLRRE